MVRSLPGLDLVFFVGHNDWYLVNITADYDKNITFLHYDVGST